MSGRRRAILGFALALIAFAALPALAAAASISGTVTDETTDVGIAGIEVCPTPQPYSFEVGCVETDFAGHYSLNGLAPTQYMLSFSAWRNNLPYVSEFYDNKPSNLGADLVALNSPEEARQLDVELAEGGSISGTLTDEDTGQPVASMAACARDNSAVYERCTKSDAVGHYQINGLPSGEYSVWYEGWNLANYLQEFYEDKETWAQATRVSVIAPAVTSGIDAELAKGAEILGHVSDVETGSPLYSVMVCAGVQADPERGPCTWTDAGGDYAIRGMAAGTYLVEFGVQTGPFSRSVGQWWNGAAIEEEAEPIVIAPPESLTGINGALPGWYGSPLPGSGQAAVGGEQTSGPSPFASIPTAAPKPRFHRCRKGFHRKLIQGKKRCVRKHRHHPRHHSR